jgi:hypothetical protein
LEVVFDLSSGFWLSTSSFAFSSGFCLLASGFTLSKSPRSKKSPPFPHPLPSPAIRPEILLNSFGAAAQKSAVKPAETRPQILLKALGLPVENWLFSC